MNAFKDNLEEAVRSRDTGDLKQSAEDLAEMLKLGNVNFYMFEGGTNFGFMNGSNYYDRLTVGLGWVVLALALGKSFGNLLQYLMGWTQ